MRDAALSAVLFAPAATSMLVNAWHSKVTGERRLHSAITLAVGGVAFMCANYLLNFNPILCAEIFL